MANLFWGKKKIAVVGVNGNPMAKRIVEEMKAQGMKGVVELDAPIMRCDSDSGKKLIKSMVLRTADRQGMC